MDVLGIKYTVNSRGGLNLLHSGYYFNKHLVRKGQIYWSCTKKGKLKQVLNQFYSDYKTI